MAASPWRTRLLLIGLSAFIAVLVLAALEGGLRLVGLGQKDPLRSQLKYQQLYLPVLRPDQRADGTAILRPIDPRIPYQEVLREKPANSLRVFTFGGSATAGLGYSPNVTFARHLRGMLEEAYPGRAVEVINLGIVAIASRQVKQLVGDVVRHYKPEPESYLKSVALLSLQPAEVMLVAAHASDLEAAAACGLRAAYVRRPEEHGPNTYKEPDTSAFDYVADDFLDLADQLGS